MYAPNITEPIANRTRKIVFDMFKDAQTKLRRITNRKGNNAPEPKK